MIISELVNEIFEWGKSKGWHDGKPRSALEDHALFHSEIGEATEEVRAGNPIIYQLQTDPVHPGATKFKVEPDDELWDSDFKPEGEAIELADTVIRIMHYFGTKGWDLEKAIELKMIFNHKRLYRHGNKKY